MKPSVPLSDALVTDGRSGLVRWVRHGDSSVLVHAGDEIGLVLKLGESLSVTRRLDERTATVVPAIGAVTVIPSGCPSAFTLAGAARVLMLRLPWRQTRRWNAEEHGRDWSRPG